MRRSMLVTLLWTMLSTILSTMLSAPSMAARVDNFRLLDHRGIAHELYYHSHQKAVVIMTHGNGCPIVRQSLPALRALRHEFGGQSVSFLLLNTNSQDDRASIQQEAREFDIDFPVLVDSAHLIGESLSVTRTAEILILNPADWSIAYRGPVDDRLSLGAQKPYASRHYAAEALQALLAGQAVATPSVPAVGCLVDLPTRAALAPAAYAEQIAPLLQEKCTACHRPGGVGPWAMTGYRQVRGFTPMIREVIRTKRMPPWHADPHHGSFAGDRSLTDEQARMLVQWVEAGAPRGEGPDPLETVTAATSPWPLGEPDLMVEVPPFDVPATGVVDYKYPRVAHPLKQDMWVRAIDIHPGDRAVVHHVLAGVVDRTVARSIVEDLAAFGGYSPGRNALPLPENTGVLLQAGADLLFQMHYTPNGKATRDVTRIGFYFHREPPRHRLKLQFMHTRSLRIPAGAAAYTEVVSHTFDKDVMLYSLMPHAHLRGKAAQFVAHFPDGTEEVLLSVPTYDFNWQTVYSLTQPKVLPAGTRVAFHMTWDNSAQNPANPDPTREVPWGDQTWDEMNAGWMRYRDLLPEERSGRQASAR